LGGFAIGARVALLWQHNANPSYKLASIPRYDDIVRGLRAPPTGDRRATGGAPKTAPHTGSGRGWPAADGAVLNITAAVWTAGFHWWRSGNKKRTQNVSEYMLVLALCLVERQLRPPCFPTDNRYIIFKKIFQWQNVGVGLITSNIVCCMNGLAVGTRTLGGWVDTFGTVRFSRWF